MTENANAYRIEHDSMGDMQVPADALYGVQTVRAINKRGVTVLLVEQNARAALRLAARGYVLEVGRVVREDAAASLLADPGVREAYLGG